MIRTALLLRCDLLPFLVLTCSSHTSFAAENLFLRKQLAFDVQRKVKPLATRAVRHDSNILEDAAVNRSALSDCMAGSV